MGYSTSAILALAAQCAPNVAPQTVAAIVETESRGVPLALNVNGMRNPPAQTNALDAARIARSYIAAGYSVDLGLGQINSRNMRKIGLTWETVFDPCTNIAALGRVLTGNYKAALTGRDPQAALRIAFSLYNTGSSSRGFRNGYVGWVVSNAGVTDRRDFSLSLSDIDAEDKRLPIVAENMADVAVPTAREAPPPAWNLFAHAAYARRAALSTSTNRRASVWSD